MTEQHYIDDILPLSPLQEGILFHSLHTDPTAYQTQVIYDMRGKVDVEAFRLAWEAMITRQSALRTAFLWEGVPEPVQVVYAQVPTPLSYVDLSAVPEAERRLRADQLLAADAVRSFDLGEPPLMQLSLLQLEDARFLFGWTHHALIHDGWSTIIVGAELAQIYSARRAGVEPALAAAPSYRAYLTWLAGADHRAAMEFWQDRLANLEEVTSLSLGGKPRLGGRQVATCEAHAHVSDSALRQAAQRWSATPSVVAQAAWALVQMRLSRGYSVVFGQVVAGRAAPVDGIENMVGQLANTLPVSVRAKPGMPLTELIGRMQQDHATSLRYQHVPFADLQRAAGVPTGGDLFSSVFAFQNHAAVGAGPRAELGFTTEPIAGIETTHYPLTIFVVPEDDRTTVRITYDTEFAGEDTAQLLAEALCHVLTELAGRSEGMVDDISVLAPAWRDRAAQWHRQVNDSSLARVHDAVTLPAAVEEMVRQHPQAPAVIGSPGLTYRDLDERSTALAARLLRLGICPGDRVALLLERSPELVISILAILKAGGAWVPVDVLYPLTRIGYMLANSGAKLLVTRSDHHGDLMATLPPIDHIVDLAQPSETFDGTELPRLSSDNAAYVIYTSGSTGTPNGVVVSHRAVLNTIRWMQRAYDIGPGSVIAMKTMIGFTDSAAEVLGALCAGAALAVYDTDTVRDPAALVEGFARDGVSHAVWVPRALEGFLAEQARTGCPTASLRWALNGGEQLPPVLVRMWEQLNPDGARIANPYGMTEGAIYSTSHVPTRGEAARTGVVPIGLPIDGASVYVLDPAFELCSTGQPGALFVGGASLAQGYLGKPGLTAARFLPDPRSIGGRLYHTGDVARWTSEGVLEYLGRADQQMKIRGMRVEPAEVEAALAMHPAVRDAVVMAARDSQGGQRLIAYVAQDRALRVPDDDLHRFVATRLPEHSRPAGYVWVERLPLTTHGKVDRKALPPFDWAVAARAEFVAPVTELEQSFAMVWAEVLGLPRVGLHDHFFDCGGDSLLVLRAVGRLREITGQDIRVRDLFDHPTVAGACEALTSRTEIG